MYACRVVAGFSRGWEGTGGVYRALSGLQEDMQAIGQQSASLLQTCNGMARKKIALKMRKHEAYRGNQ